MVGYYDAILGLIPLTLASITGALALSGFALTTAVMIASLAPVGLIVHAMFVSPPTDDRLVTPTASSSSGNASLSD